jgi:phosphoglycerate kinase
MKKITQFKNLKNKTVLVRVGFNVPLKGKKVKDDFKIQSTLPTIKYLLKQQASVVIISHLGRPKGVDNKLSLLPIAKHLEGLLKHKVELIKDYSKVKDSKSKLMLLENIRFDKRERSDDINSKKQLAKELSELGEYLVYDAFAVSHRQDASVYYLPDYLPTCVGFNIQSELSNLKLAKGKGVVAVMGGAKVSTKVKLIKKILPKVNYLLVGGALANTFLLAVGLPIGKSLHEPEMVETCKGLINTKIILPIDVVVESRGKRQIKPVSEVKKYDKIYDIGPATIEYYADIIKTSKAVVWNGPMGVFEKSGFEKGSYAIAMAVASTKGKTIVGGGETLAIISHLNLYTYYNFVSTGGGAMLKYLENKTLLVLKKLNIK